MNATQIVGIRNTAEPFVEAGPYQLVSHCGQVIAFGLSYRKAREWGQHYGGSIVRRYDVRAFERWAADIAEYAEVQ